MATVTIGGKQIAVTPKSFVKPKELPHSHLTYSHLEYLPPQIGGASFGGGLPAQKIVPKTVTQQQLITSQREATRTAELASRQQSLATNAAILGQERATIASEQRKLDALTAKVSEAAKKPLTTDIYFNKLIREQRALAEKLGNRAATFNERIGEQNRLSKGLAEQYQVKEVKEMKEFSPDIKLSRTERGTLYSTFTSPETLRKRAIAEQRAISGTPLREQFGLEASETTRVGSRIEKEARERALSGKIGGLPGQYALQKETLAKYERKRPFASTEPISSLGLTPGERQAEPIVRESIAKFEGPTRQRVKLLAEQRQQNPLLAIPIGWEELSTGGEITGRRYFAEIAGKEPAKVTEFKRKAQEKTTEFLGLQRTPLGTGEFNLFVGTREERQAKFGAVGRELTQLATLELAFAGADIGLKFAKSGKSIKTFDIGQAGGIGAGKKKVFKLPEVPSIPKGTAKIKIIKKTPALIPTKELFADVRLGIQKGAIPEIGKFTEKKIGRFTQLNVPTKEAFADVRLGIQKGAIPDITKFVKRESARVVEKAPKFADELAGGLKSGYVPKITEKFAKKESGKVFTLGASEQALAFKELARKGKVPAFDMRGLKIIDMPKQIDLGGVVALVKTKPVKSTLPFKRTPFNFGYLLETEKATTTTAGLVTTPQWSIGKFVSEITKLEKTIKPKPAPFLSLNISGSYAALAGGLPRVTKTPTELLFEREMFGFEETVSKVKPREIRGFEKIAKEAELSAERGLAQFAGIREQAFGISTEFARIKQQALGTKKEFGGISEQYDITSPRLDFTFKTKKITKPVSITEQRKSLDVGLRTDLGLKSDFVSISKQREALDTKLKTDTRLKTITSTIPIQLSLTRDLTRQRQDTISIQRIIPINLSITSARTRTITKPRIMERTVLTEPTIEITKTRVPPFFVPFAKRTFKPVETFGYKVFVRGKGVKTKTGWKPGEFIPATKGVLGRKEALAFGQSIVAGTARRTFKIVPTVGKRATVGRIPKFRPEMFRTKGRTFVEKTRYAIDQPGERREITQAGISKLQGLRLTGFTPFRKKVKRKKPKTRKKKKTKRR